MGIYLQEINDNLRKLLPGTKSSRSVARAYKQYLADKTRMTSKVLTALASAVAYEKEDDSSSSNIEVIVNEIIESSNVQSDSPVFTTEGEVVKISDMVRSIVEQGIENGPTMESRNGTEININDTVDALVESFQTSKVIESAFSVLEETEDGVRVAFSDIHSRVSTLGMTMTTSASNTLLAIGDLMSDTSSGVIDKIAVIGTFINSGIDKIMDDTDDQSPINIPTFGDEGFDAVPPVHAFLQDITFDWFKPYGWIKPTVRIFVGIQAALFGMASEVVKFGWNSTSKYVSDTFIDPVDFQLVNKRSKSHIVDVPIFDYTEDITSYEFDSGTMESAMFNEMLAMKIGSMKSTYTPYGIINLVKVNATQVRTIMHVIPTSPINKSFALNDTAFIQSIQPLYQLSGSSIHKLLNEYSPGILWDMSNSGIFKRFIDNDRTPDFIHSGDDDGYYLSAIAASMVRLQIVINQASMLYEESYLRVLGIEDKKSYSVMAAKDYIGWHWEWVEKTGGRTTSNDSTWLQLHDRPHIQDALKGNLTGNSVTNKMFYDMMTYQGDVNYATMIPIYKICFLNNYEVMEKYQELLPGIPSMVPSVYENTYQTPMYEISTDGKNAQAISKFFKGLLITAAVVVTGVIVGKAAIKIKNIMRMESLRISGLERAFQTMDPNSPNYSNAYREYNSARKKFNRKNSFLSFLGMGVSKTATSTMIGIDNIEEFIPGNNSIIESIERSEDLLMEEIATVKDIIK